MADLWSGVPLPWKAVIDNTSGNTYYYNVVTNETSWSPPPPAATPTVLIPPLDPSRGSGAVHVPAPARELLSVDPFADPPAAATRPVRWGETHQHSERCPHNRRHYKCSECKHLGGERAKKLSRTALEETCWHGSRLSACQECLYIGILQGVGKGAGAGGGRSDRERSNGAHHDSPVISAIQELGGAAEVLDDPNVLDRLMREINLNACSLVLQPQHASASGPSAVTRRLSFDGTEEQVRAFFDRIDRNGDQSISVQELILALRRDAEVASFLQLPQCVRQEDGSRETFETFFQALDRDGSRDLDWDEFRGFFLEPEAGAVDVYDEQSDDRILLIKGRFQDTQHARRGRKESPRLQLPSASSRTPRAPTSKSVVSELAGVYGASERKAYMAKVKQRIMATNHKERTHRNDSTGVWEGGPQQQSGRRW